MSATGRTMHGGLVALAAASEIDGKGRQWIEVMPTASEARNGRFYFTVTADDLATYAASIAANAERIMVDRDHEGAVGGSTKAAGWFTGETEIVDDTARGPILRARVQWTPSAVQEINDGEFRFISPEFGFESKDAKTGLMTKAKDFVAATLTNRPFFSELAALAADGGPVLWDAMQGVNKLQSAISEALNPGVGSYDDMRFWVLDVDVANNRALVSSYGPDDDAWIVPFQVDADGVVSVPPTVDWIAVEHRDLWVADTDDGPGMASLARIVALAAAKTAEIESCSSGDMSGYQAKGGAMCHTHDGTAKGIGKAKQAAMRDAMKTAAAAAALTTGGSAATTQEDHMSDTLKALAVDLGLPEDATDEQITDAVKAAKEQGARATQLETELAAARASGDDEVKLDRATYESLKTQAADGATARAEQVRVDRESKIDEAIKAGKIMPARRDHFLALAERDHEGTLAYLDQLEGGVIPVEDVVLANGDAAQGQLDTVRAHLGLKTTATV